MESLRRRAACGVLLLLASFLGPSHAAAARVPGLCTAVSTDATAPYVAILSAFPAELVPLVAATQVESTTELEGRQYYLGRLHGVRVVLGLTGIGVVNAADRATSVVGGFALAGMIMSGVAGSPNNIADVVLPDDWVQTDVRGVFHPNAALMALARRGTDPLPAPLEKCTLVPPGSPTAELVCMPHDPKVVLGGRGVSGDPFGGPFACLPGGHDVFGCELPPVSLVAFARAEAPPDVEDMETTAVARAAKAGRVPFLGIRAASDGKGDPKGDRGFPTQFFDYYRLAAENAAAVTIAVVAELADAAQDQHICKLLAKRKWRGAAKRIARGS